MHSLMQLVMVVMTQSGPYVDIQGPARADTLFKSATNMEWDWNTPGAIEFYRMVVLEYYGTTQATAAAKRIVALGGKVPASTVWDRWNPGVELARKAAQPKPARYVPRTVSKPVPPRTLTPVVNVWLSDPAPVLTSDLSPASSGSSARSSARSSGSGPVHVRSYTRTSKSGKTTTVRSHSRSR